MFVKPPIELSWSHTQAIEGLKFIGSQVLTAWEQGVSVALESTRIGNKSISKRILYLVGAINAEIQICRHSQNELPNVGMELGTGVKDP